jgi:hypothetical protein
LDRFSLSPIDTTSMSNEDSVESILLERCGQYVGYFKDDLPDGTGLFTLNNGQSFECRFRDGILIK